MFESARVCFEYGGESEFKSLLDESGELDAEEIISGSKLVDVAMHGKTGRA